MGRLGFLLLIGVLVSLIVGLTGCGSRSQTHQAPVKRTEALLQLVQVLSTEYRAEFNQPVNHYVWAKSAIDWSKARLKNADNVAGSGIPDDSIERFVWAVLQIERLGDGLNGLAAKGWMVDSDGDGFLELVDGWGNKIAYAAYVKRDDDFTDDDFFPSSNRPLFISAGPDGKFGSFAPQNQADDAAKDNLRSDHLKAGIQPVK